MQKQKIMRERIENWYNMRDPDIKPHIAMGEDSESIGFQTVEELINFKTNPYFDNLVRFNN